MLNTAGMVLLLYLLSLKHKIPCDISVVLDIYTENPKKDDVIELYGPEIKKKYKVPI